MHRSGTASMRDARDVVGDALWAAMILWLAGVVAPRARLRWRALAALGVCVGVEAGQLVRAPWLAALRESALGHLVLGSDFDPRDLAAYAAGVAAAALLDRALARGRDGVHDG